MWAKAGAKLFEFDQQLVGGHAVAGHRVDLNSPEAVSTDFEAPDADSRLVFELRVKDAACLSDADRVVVRTSAASADSGGSGSLGTSVLFLAILAAIGRGLRDRWQHTGPTVVVSTGEQG